MIGSLQPQINNTFKVAIFDIDNTLTIYESDDRKCSRAIRDVQPVWPYGSSGTTQTVLDVLKECDNNNFHIAIATAETGDGAYDKQQKDFLFSLGQKSGLHNKANIKFNSLFGTEEWINSSLFQNTCTVLGYNQHNYNQSSFCRKEPCEFSTSKIPHYMNILNFLNIPPTRYHQSIVFDDSVQNLADASKIGLQTCQASLSCGGHECQGGCGLEPSSIDLIRNQPRLSHDGTYFKALSSYNDKKCNFK